MRLGAFSLGYIVRVGLAALVFLLLFKWAARKSGVGALQAVAAAA